MFKTITWLLLSLEPSELCLRNLHQYAPEPSGTCLRNLHQHAPELSKICRNPPEPSGRFRNLPLEPTPLPGTLRHSAELSGTLRNLPLEPPPAHTGTLRNFRNLSLEPAPATRTGTHRSLSGLKTPLAYAVGEKREKARSENTWQLSPSPHALCRYKCFAVGSLALLPFTEVGNFESGKETHLHKGAQDSEDLLG